jgi:hypothetical protein
MKKLCLLLALALFTFYVNAQILEWAKQIGGAGYDSGLSIAVDASGNVYTTGIFQGTADFDPGPGTFNLVSAGGWDIFISKLDATGNFVWAKSMGGAGDEISYSIALDAAGNVYITGWFEGTADFDPGPGIFNLVSEGHVDIFISKLDASGNFIWAKSVGGSIPDVGYSIIVDTSANVYITGFFSGTVDFDPDPSVNYFLTAAVSSDAFILKLDSAGNFVWAKAMSGTNGVYSFSIALDASGNVYTTGNFQGTVDFDPAPAVNFNLTSGGSTDIFVSKLDSGGNFVWAKQMGGTAFDYGFAIAVDASFNVYVTGSFQVTADFNPDPSANFYMTSSGNSNVFISKLDSGGNFIWAKQIAGTLAGEGAGRSIVVDSSGNVYTIGEFLGTADFDPGAGVHNLTPSGGSDVFISKLDATGNFLWAGQLGGPNNDYGHTLVTDALGNVYISGEFRATSDFDPDPTGIFNLTSIGGADVFVHKMSQCIPLSLTTLTTNAICNGDTGAATVIATGGTSTYTYSWSNGQTTQTATGLIAGTYSVTVVDDSSCVAVATVVITEPTAIISNITSTPTNFPSPNCDGSVSINPTGGTPPYSISWSSGTTTNLCEGWYTATITDANGCVVTDSVYVSFQCPSILLSIATTGPPLCYGHTEALSASALGGTSPYIYLWSSGDTTAGVNLSTGIYIVTVTDANMCTATSTFAVSTPPEIASNISSTPTNFTSPNCNGSVSINPTGGTPPYNISWSSGTTNLCEGWYTATITDANGCVETDSVYVNFVTSIEELNAAGISIHPNPANDVLTINSENIIGEIKIYDVLGKLILKRIIKEKNTDIDVSKIKAGIYFLEIETTRVKFMK